MDQKILSGSAQSNLPIKIYYLQAQGQIYFVFATRVQINVSSMLHEVTSLSLCTILL